METYLGSTELTKIKINSYYRINVVDLDAYSVNQPIGNQRRNNPTVLLVGKCTDLGMKIKLFEIMSHIS